MYKVIALIILASVCPAQAQYSGGSGTADDPYQIATAADLLALGETPDDYDKHFILTADIDLDPNLPGRKVFDRAVIAPDWQTSFTGIFNGNDRTISHLTIDGAGLLGLFGQLGSEAQVSDLALEGVSANGTGCAIGGLAGGNGGDITNCHCAGTVRDEGDCWYHGGVGGLVGDNHGSIISSSSTAAVVGDCWLPVGGLVGRNQGRIALSYSAGTVTGMAAHKRRACSWVSKAPPDLATTSPVNWASARRKGR